MCYLAALYANGRVVTGRHHGEAYTKLSPQDQDKELYSGFLDPKTGRFILEDSQFYVKKIIMIRHAQPGVGDDPGIDQDIGRAQCKRAVNFLMARFNLPDYVVRCSPKRRCQDTMHAMFEEIDIECIVDPLYDLRHGEESMENFLGRIRHALNNIPDHTIVISHCDFIVNMSQLALAMTDPLSFCQVRCDDCHWGCRISCGSVTYLEHNKPVLVGVTDF
jgi:broad specificity phosphatase PhoE